ncbi:hypothetical protein B9T62_23070 [Paenibacillus donghaensis]|uniref:HAD family hydrolase n=1 Tax=Paenibacillus donghaensis TaxID=414771 RepID=A0A2Z2KJI6_9BACL|nr:hypothetical protein B9T62_23070 [Paenibacillus donghaensis]
MIFDLDQTVVDSRLLAPLRMGKNRNWNIVQKRIPEIQCYDGIIELITSLRQKGRKVAIVTSSPRKSYAEHVLVNFGINVDAIIGYHDSSKHKPHPDPLLKAAKLLNVNPVDILAIGDDPKDVIAAKAAEMYSGAALWGALNKRELLSSSPDFTFYNVEDIYRYIS